MVATIAFTSKLPEPIPVLENYFKNGGVSLVQATFSNSFFIDPAAVRKRTPYFPDRARLSRENYSGKERGEHALWKGRNVRLGDNARAQLAWAKYTQRPISRQYGYGVRHIWGRPWDPDAFTGGWNLCYMPFWVGMLTEEQHPHPLVERAVKQASWDLYFRSEPVCEVPPYVADPGLDLLKLLGGRPVLVLDREAGSSRKAARKAAPLDATLSVEEKIRAIRKMTSQSWKNLSKAVLALSDRPFDPFGSKNVESNSKSVVRRIRRETGLSLEDLREFLIAQL